MIWYSLMSSSVLSRWLSRFRKRDSRLSAIFAWGSREYFREAVCGNGKTGYICAPFEGKSVEKLKKQGHEQTYIPAIQYQAQKQARFPQAHVNS
jgi:hypothetical protein